MTAVEVLFRYGAPPNESAMIAFAQLSDVYGIRSLRLRKPSGRFAWNTMPRDSRRQRLRACCVPQVSISPRRWHWR